MSIGKKILGSVTVSGLLWAGATAYIGSGTESYLNNYLEKTNKIYENNGMKMSLLSFDKGFLNSKAEISLDFIEPTMKKELGKIFKLPMVMEYNIENGPLLFKDGLALGASKINSTVNINELLLDKEGFKQIVKEDIVVESSMLIDFAKKVNYKGKSNQIVATIEGDTFTVAPLKLSGKMDAETLVGTFKMTTESIVGVLENGGKSEVKELVFDGDITKFFDNGFYLGNFVMTVSEVNIDNPAFPQKIEKAMFKMVMDLAETNQEKVTTELVDMNFALDLELGETKLPAEYDIAKALTFAYGLDGVKLEGLMAFQDNMKVIQKQQQEVLAKFSSATTAEEQMKVLDELQNIQVKLQEKMRLLVADLLVKDTTLLKFNASVIDKKNAHSDAKFDLKYVGDEVLPKTLVEIEKKFKEELLNWFEFNVNLDLQKSLVSKLPKNMQQQLSMAMRTGMLKENNTSYAFDANYVPKKLMVNGTDKSDMLQLLEMTLGGGM